MSKNKAEPEGLQMTSQYGPYALHAGYARLHSCTRMHTYMHTPKRPSTRTYAHIHTHTQICNIYCFSTATMIRELVSLLRKSHIACLITFYLFYFLCTRNIFVTWFLSFQQVWDLMALSDVNILRAVFKKLWAWWWLEHVKTCSRFVRKFIVSWVRCWSK